MKVFVSTDHETHWPVGGASVVVAEAEADARTLLTEALKKHGLQQTEPFTLTEIDTTVAAAHVLSDGDY